MRKAIKKAVKKLKSFTTCEYCGKQIRGRMIYIGGGVVHPTCYAKKHGKQVIKKITSKGKVKKHVRK